MDWTIASTLEYNSQLYREKVNTKSYLLGKSNMFYENTEKAKTKRHAHKKTTTILQFSFLPKQIKREKTDFNTEATISQLWKQYLTMYFPVSMVLNSQLENSIKKSDLFLQNWKLLTHWIVLITKNTETYFYTKTTHTRSRCSKLTL